MSEHALDQGLPLIPDDVRRICLHLLRRVPSHLCPQLLTFHEAPQPLCEGLLTVRAKDAAFSIDDEVLHGIRRAEANARQSRRHGLRKCQGEALIR